MKKTCFKHSELFAAKYYKMGNICWQKDRDYQTTRKQEKENN